MPDDVKPWTIKNIAPEHRNAFTAAARRANLDIGEWMIRAGLAQIQADRAENRTPAVIPDPATPAPARDVSHIGELIRQASDLAAVSGGEVPKSVSRLAFSLIRAELQASRRQ